ncbi:hypothetical protein KFE25_005833 [Diacronema lutheri]|uniref:RNA helicase n=2 Tax=Diacronema lutheri TaxID=2081491 RepID=A0A8J5XPX1_DIALT|nr:hypothetical protein KFE25_005833 [Diacronema lutheri]
MGRASRSVTMAAGAPSFEELGVRADICEALRAQGISAPNKLQAQALPALRGGGDLILGAQTGSGKTLTYLVPLLQRLKDEEDCAPEPLVPRPSRPRALVIVPTRELGEQVKGVAKSICHYVKLRSTGISGGVPLGKQAKLFNTPLDLLVATPGRLLAHADAGHVGFSATSIFVVDEVDTIFEAGFADDLRKLLRLVDSHRHGERVQHIAVGATHPSAAKRLYADAFPAARELMVDVHTVPTQLTQRFVPVSSQSMDKCEKLIEVLGPPRDDGGLGGVRTLVFCNSKDSARFVDHYLTERRYATSNYHGGILPEARAANFKAFKEGRSEILVCSDLAARGLDGLDIAHVVQFDFARSAVDYLHRAGRTARAGKRGRVTSLVSKYDAALAREVQRAGEMDVTSQPAKRAARPAPRPADAAGRPPPASSAPATRGGAGPAAAKQAAGQPRQGARGPRGGAGAASRAPKSATARPIVKRGTRGAARYAPRNAADGRADADARQGARGASGGGAASPARSGASGASRR